MLHFANGTGQKVENQSNIMSTFSPLTVGKLLRHFRARSALSQDQLAERSGVSSRAISDLERGQRTAPHLETVRMLADALELSRGDRQALIRSARPDVIDITLQANGPPASRSAPPISITRFFGREQEVRQIADLVRSGNVRIVTITGPGGVGKTRLAEEVVAVTADAFPDDVLWIDLSAARELASAIAVLQSAVGIEGKVPSGDIGSIRTMLRSTAVSKSSNPAAPIRILPVGLLRQEIPPLRSR
ncbi:hypothetical protein BH24CHL4_BH24CHL4_13690 [soil metagenome]